jgi:glycosyltransferase involved in cell wall biosynthesis
LNPIKNQTYNNWYLYISDGNSTDNMVNIVNLFVEDNHYSSRVKIYVGSSIGFANNFLFLTSTKEIKADLFL